MVDFLKARKLMGGERRMAALREQEERGKNKKCKGTRMKYKSRTKGGEEINLCRLQSGTP